MFKKMVSLDRSDLKKIGSRVTGAGVIFTVFGVVLFCRILLAMGSMLVLVGVVLNTGRKAALQLFTSEKYFKASICFALGFSLIVADWPITGFILETSAFALLFRACRPTLAYYLPNLPIIGWIFRKPVVAKFLGITRAKRVPV